MLPRQDFDGAAAPAQESGQLGARGAEAGGLGDALAQRVAADSEDDAAVGAGAVAGQRISTGLPTAPAKTYDYNAAGQLASVAETGQATVSYSYDGDGLRTERRTGDATTRFVWDKTGDLPMLLAEDGTSYIYGPDGLPLEGIDANGTVRFYHHDRLGSTRQVTDDTGAVVAEQSYDAYGTIAETTGTARVPFGFAGEYTETDSDLIYLRARFYDPATGQFLTRDPLEPVSGQPYLYAGGDPVNAIDPEGLLSISIPSLRDVSNFAAGFGDGATGLMRDSVSTVTGGSVDIGTASDWRNWLVSQTNSVTGLGLVSSVDYCSGAYGAGGYAGTAAALALPVSGAARAGGIEVRLLERQRRGGMGLANVRNLKLRGDNRLIALDRHPLRNGGRPKVHVDMPRRGIKHWPHER